jgi:predicted ester cyclase
MDWPAFQQFGQGFYAAFPDLQHVIAGQVAEGDTVVNQLVVRGTHQQPFQGIAPTGTVVTVTAITIQRFAAGQVVEQRLLIDTLGLLQQLGAVPLPEPAPA